MSGLELKYKLDLSRIEGGFKRLAGVDTKPLMDAIGAHQVGETQRNFKEGRTPTGERWIESQAARNRGLEGDDRRQGQTLKISDRLMKSYVHEPTKNSVEVGSNLVYSAIHHFGFDGDQVVKSHNRLISQAFGKPLRGPTWQTVASFTRTMHMPARPALGITPSDELEYEDLVQKFISQHLSGASL